MAGWVSRLRGTDVIFHESPGMNLTMRAIPADSSISGIARLATPLKLLMIPESGKP
jgi:hypothetical protein